MGKNLWIVIALASICLVVVLYLFFWRVETQTVVLESGDREPKTMIKNGVDFSSGEAVDVIDYEGSYILVRDLRVGESHPRHATGSGCPEKHWHADAAVTAVNDGNVLTDPNSGGCGFGTLSERPIANYFPHELLAD